MMNTTMITAFAGETFSAMRNQTVTAGSKIVEVAARNIPDVVKAVLGFKVEFTVGQALMAFLAISAISNVFNTMFGPKESKYKAWTPSA